MASSQANNRYTVRVSDPSELEGIRFGDDEATKEPVINVDADIVMVPPPPRRSDRQAASILPSTTPKTSRRRTQKTPVRLSKNSPVLVEALEITNQHSTMSLSDRINLASTSMTKFALVGAIQPNYVLETIHALGTMQEFKCPHAKVHEILHRREYYPLNLVFAKAPEPISVVDENESPPVKKRKKSKTKQSLPKAKQPCLISLLSSDEEDGDGDTDMVVDKETKVPEAASVQKVSCIPVKDGESTCTETVEEEAKLPEADPVLNVSSIPEKDGGDTDMVEEEAKPTQVAKHHESTILARPDPTPGYQLDEWVLTPFGPGRIESHRVDRFSDSLDSMVNPILLYQVSLAFGMLFVSAPHVHPFEGSAYANQVIVSDEKYPLTRGDVLRLQPDTYLNDNLVNFFIQRLPKQARIHVFSSYFYTRINDLCLGQDKTTPEFQSTLWQHLKGWIKHVDIWDQDFLLIPIHDKLHWSLLVVCHPGVLLLQDIEEEDRVPCLLHLDSGKRFRLHNYVPICARLRVFLQVCLEHQHDVKRELTRENVPGGSPPVPAQANETDCGMYMLEWMERFVTTMTEFRVTEEFVQAKGNVAPFGKTAFPQSLIDWKRNEYQSLVYTLSTSIEEG